MKTVLGKKNLGLKVTSIFINCMTEGLVLTESDQSLGKINIQKKCQ